MKSKLILGVFACIFALAFAWALWELWCWAMPQVWPDGPRSIVSPSYLLFVAETVLLRIFGILIFGMRESKI